MVQDNGWSRKPKSYSESSCDRYHKQMYRRACVKEKKNFSDLCNRFTGQYNSPKSQPKEGNTNSLECSSRQKISQESVLPRR
jgi:hypothetical protein